MKTLEEAHDPLDDIVRRFNERWFQKIFEAVMLKKRRNELELYKLLAGDCEPWRSRRLRRVQRSHLDYDLNMD